MSTTRRNAQLLAGIILLGGCGERAATESAGNDQLRPAASQSAARKAEERDLATLRRVTTPFQHFDVAKNASWSTMITGCMTSPAGGMGFHYGNTALIDDSVRVNEPELLLYEPDQAGNLNLVAVEYIIPRAMWTS